MVTVLFLAITAFQRGDLPTFSFQRVGTTEAAVEGKLDFGVHLGDRLKVPEPEPEPVEKKKGKWITRMKDRLEKRAEQRRNQKPIPNHGLRIITLEKSPNLHPWMQMFDVLEAGVDSESQIKLLRATVYSQPARNEWLTSERAKKTERSFDTAFEKADYTKVALRYGQVVSDYLASHFPYSEGGWIDPANRAIVLSYINQFDPQRYGLIIEVFDGSIVIKQIKSQLDEIAEKERKRSEWNKQMLDDYNLAQEHSNNLSLEFYFNLENGKTFEWLKEKLGTPYTSRSQGDVTVFVWRKIVSYDISSPSFAVPEYGYLYAKLNNQGVVIGKSQDGLK